MTIAASPITQVLDTYRKYLIFCWTMEQIPTDALTEELTIQLGRRTTVLPYRAGDTVLETARLAGLNPPSSCELGSCATCMARVVEGSVRMVNNEALDDEEVADGWVLTCQSLPVSRTVRVVYE
jgi:ferredoxin